MSDATTKELAACLDYAGAVARVLPVSDAVDTAIARAMAQRPSAPGRKLTRKARP